MRSCVDLKGKRELEIAEYWKNEGLKHADPSPETVEFIRETSSSIKVLIERLDNVIEENKSSHKEIIVAQKHTNGDVTDLKAWKISATSSLKTTAFIFSIVGVLFSYIYYLFIQNLKYSITDSINKNNIELKVSIKNEIQDDMHNIAKKEIENFANKNFDNYNK